MGLGILCPGQGSQHPGMLEVLAGDRSAERVLAEGGTVLGTDLRELVKSPTDIYRNQVAQPLLCATQMATWAALQEQLPAPLAFAGYSVGELAAYGCAGSLSPTSLVELAGHRALLMDEASEERGALVAIRGLPREQVDLICRHTGAEIAIVNAYDRFIIGADAAVVYRIQDMAGDLGALVTPLPVAVAAHTRRLASAAAAFRKLLADSDLADPTSPVLSGVHATPVHRRDEAIDMLAEQIATTIDWSACLRTLPELGCTVLLELGPGNGLSQMARESQPDLVARSVADFRSLAAVEDWVARSLRRFDGS
jgi:[acyl-carrier-protein] S-malonyltransferase